MAIKRMDHVGVIVEDLEAATEFFLRLGLERQGDGEVEGDWVGRVVGLDGVRAQLVMLQTADGHGRLELVKFHSPLGPKADRDLGANVPGIRHLAFEVEDLDGLVAGVRADGGELVGELENYRDVYRLCYVRGPEGIIVELAERVG
jgi:catechol 2,3-dioxygenase-like lactoylglutathione lyase family enzyme